MYEDLFYEDHAEQYLDTETESTESIIDEYDRLRVLEKQAYHEEAKARGLI